MKSLLVVIFLWSLALSQMLKATEAPAAILTKVEIAQQVQLQRQASEPNFLSQLGLEFRQEVAPVYASVRF